MSSVPLATRAAALIVIHAAHIGDVADKIIQRQSLVIETFPVDEEHRRHFKLRAERCRKLTDRCIGIVEGHQHWPRRQRVTVATRDNVLQADRSVVSGDKPQRSLEVLARDRAAQSLCKWRFRIGNVVEKYRSQRKSRAEKAEQCRNVRGGAIAFCQRDSARPCRRGDAFHGKMLWYRRERQRFYVASNS